MENAYQYDIDRCFTNILKYNNIIDFSNIEKTVANISVGKMIRHDKRLYDFLKYKTKDILRYFVYVNDIKLNDIISLERDGIILTKYINDEQTIFDKYTIRMKDVYRILIKNPNASREMLLLTDDGVRLKGVSKKTIGIENFLFKYFRKIIGSDRSYTYKIISKLIYDFYNTDDLSIFLIDDGDQYKIICEDKEIKVMKNINLEHHTAFDFNIHRKLYFANMIYNFLSVFGSYKFNEF